MRICWLWLIALFVVCSCPASVWGAESRDPEGSETEVGETAVSETAASETAEGAQTVYVIPIRDDIMPPVLYVVRRGIKEAIEAEADVVVLDMETNGGRVDTTEELIEILNRFEGKMVTYVNKKAFSAGAFISVATESIYMAPGSVIGAAAPILMAPGGAGVDAMPDTMEVKMTSGISALVRANAERYGHNVEVIEAMIDKSKELKVGDEVLCEKGQILTLTNTEAEKQYGPEEKPLLSAGTMSDLDTLLADLGMAEAAVVRVEPSGSEQLGAWINKISPILLMIGLLGLYLEFKTPGFGLPGIVGILAFAIYFLGGNIAGLSSLGWGAVFLLGLVLLIVEIFLIPGTVVAGLAGVGLMLVSIIMALVEWDPTVPAYAVPSMEQFSTPIEALSMALLGVLVSIVLLGKYLPRTPLYGALISESASGMDTEAAVVSEQDHRLGLHGTVVSGLRPGGKARFGDEILDVITQGEMIEAGVEVKIIDFSGRDAVVVAV